MDLNLPKKYLSYSALNLWWTNKDAYRKRYYENITPPDNVFTIFGREVHEMLESDTHLTHIPRLSESEVRVMTKIDGVPLLGYIDGYDSESGTFLDYKTSVNPWTQLKVEKLDQLPFYAVLIEDKFEKKPKTCQVVWIETRFKENVKQVGNTKIDLGGQLELTNHFEVFTRKIYKKERDEMRKRIVDSAVEISKDYTAWQKTN